MFNLLAVVLCSVSILPAELQKLQAKFCLGESAAEQTYVFFHRMSTKFFAESLKNLLTHPSTFGESGEGEVVRVDFTQT